jgi:branched-chain amino acid transport system ATP-binding protein
MIKIKDLNAGYGEIQILWDMNIEIKEKTITALIGGNGVGKTTLLRTMVGAIKPYSGSIEYMGKDILRKPQPERTSDGIMLVPEGRQLYNGLTIEDNLFMGAYTRKDKAGIKRSMEFVYSIFPRLKDRRKQLAGTLSGGEAQMCAIARGIMAAPKLLLLDELSLGLAPVIVDDLVRILKQIHKEEGMTILLVDQDVQTALEIASYGYVIVQGNVAMSGESKELINNPDIQKAYLGL